MGFIPLAVGVRVEIAGVAAGSRVEAVLSLYRLGHHPDRRGSERGESDGSRSSRRPFVGCVWRLRGL